MRKSVFTQFHFSTFFHKTSFLRSRCNVVEKKGGENLNCLLQLAHLSAVSGQLSGRELLFRCRIASLAACVQQIHRYHETKSGCICPFVNHFLATIERNQRCHPQNGRKPFCVLCRNRCHFNCGQTHSRCSIRPCSKFADISAFRSTYFRRPSPRPQGIQSTRRV